VTLITSDREIARLSGLRIAGRLLGASDAGKQQADGDWT
jgi:hypothetical protein